MGDLAGDRFDELEITSIEQLHTWLQHNHAQRDGIWLISYKKATPDKYIPHDSVLDALVASGWCDGIRRRVDDHRTMQLISPRRTEPWAKSYKDRADRLIADGHMHPAGQASVAKAKSTGMWDTMNDVDALIIPADLAAALEGQPPAANHFTNFPPSTRRNMLRWIASARTDATRSRRITLIAQDAQQNVRTKTNG